MIAPYGGVKIDGHPSLVRYVERIGARASVKEALSVEVPLYTKEVGKIPTRVSA